MVGDDGGHDEDDDDDHGDSDDVCYVLPGREEAHGCW